MKILVIEDSASILKALNKDFKSKHISADLAPDGADGLKKLISGKYDLAVVDLGLPKLSGQELIKRAKTLGVRTPILVLTAEAAVDQKVELLELGVDDYMVKPYSFEELYARVQAILRRERKDFPSQYLTIGDLQVVPGRQMAIRGNKEIRLRKKEYQLLKYFMNHPNEPLDRETLTKEVWGSEARLPSNTVDTHISTLRARINRGFRRKLIRSIYGVGYILETADD